MRDVVRPALDELGIDALVLVVHDRSFPAGDGDLGCGAPASAAGRALLGLAADLGFTGLQLGPPGRISEVNLSPYDGTLFARSPLNLAWDTLAREHPGLVDDALLARLEQAPASWCDYPHAFAASAALLEALHHRWPAELDGEVERFLEAEAWWLLPDALHQALWPRWGTTDARRWGDPALAGLWTREHAALREEVVRAERAIIHRVAREQWLLEAQHRGFRAAAREAGLTVSADFQAGLSHADRWALAALVLDGLAMGAPPSRTNPEGQPWGYPVLDPAQMGTPEAPGPVLELVRRRALRAFAAHDGVRIDHPHALVCPWVYREGTGDELAALRAGARLGSSCGLLPELDRFDIVEPAQCRRQVDPWADGFVSGLSDAQVARYAAALDVVMDVARAAGRPASSVVCEVLSTVPAPLAAVIERHGLGRFRVTTKANVSDPSDVYLPDTASPLDRVMVGTHDTLPVWTVAERWPATTVARRVDWLVGRLAPDGEGAESLAGFLRSSRSALVLGELASLFAGPARQVLVFASDLLGEREPYNRPGVVHPDNWRLRVPPDVANVHAARAARGEAMDLPAALALALLATPHPALRRRRTPLVRALLARTRASIPALPERMLDIEVTPP